MVYSFVAAEAPKEYSGINTRRVDSPLKGTGDRALNTARETKEFSDTWSTKFLSR